MFLTLAFVAGLVRGYSGFGFAMLLSLGLLVRLPPAQVVPVSLMLDIVCSASLWPGAWGNFHRGIGFRLIGGMLLAVPLGALLLSVVPGAWMAPLVALFCLFGGVLVLWRPPTLPSHGVRSWLAWPAGLASGLAMTMASAGGPPLILYLLRSGLDPSRVRATAILFFVASSGCSLFGLWLFGVLAGEHLHMALSLAAPAIAGNLLGQWLHSRWQPVPMRLVVGAMLVLMSLAVLWSSLRQLGG